ncbi:hypothetical protein [Pseudoclavibacter sp. VKM Ac-2867]|uniref:hypothetical protein n=1 Tax=Pseudoclavibacter sp. VKM Ac-2867 TaxID=2783829 RepID=UPI001889CB2C|nr:hypothetical protein [Pseudoclavibacter sp. VKM Ac-2867]MBF4460527.1 hypothetical protein [Pseudoclavibacter sp. VKM Ac-2867]
MAVFLVAAVVDVGVEPVSAPVDDGQLALVHLIRCDPHSPQFGVLLAGDGVSGVGVGVGPFEPPRGLHRHTRIVEGSHVVAAVALSIFVSLREEPIP